jgi:hypothetical protein
MIWIPLFLFVFFSIFICLSAYWGFWFCLLSSLLKWDFFMFLLKRKNHQSWKILVRISSLSLSWFCCQINVMSFGHLGFVRV